MNVDLPKGIPAGSYRIRVLTRKGISALSDESLVIANAAVPLPEVTAVYPMAVAYDGDNEREIIITGFNFSESIADNGVEMGDVDSPITLTDVTFVDSTEIRAKVPAAVPEGVYDLRVYNTRANHNLISAVKFEVYKPVSLATAVGVVEGSTGVDMPDDGVVPVTIALLTDDRQEAPVVSDARMEISATFEPGTRITHKNEAGEDVPYVGTIDPPRQVVPPKELSLKEDAAVFTLGNPDKKLTLGENQFIFVTLDVILPMGAEEPQILYYDPADGSLTPAGKGVDADGNQLLHNGIPIAAGGTKMSTRWYSPELDKKTITYGLYLDHMSTYVAGFEEIASNSSDPGDTPAGTGGTGSTSAASDSSSGGSSTCFISSAETPAGVSKILWICAALALLFGVPALIGTRRKH